MSRLVPGGSPIVAVPARPGRRDDQDLGAGLPIQMMNQAYIAALQRAGATPVLIPLGTPLPERLNWVSGLLLPGGADVDPHRYGEAPHPTSEWDPELDRLEFHLLEWALGAGVPVLGVCRGLQVLNVALGGTLYQDLTTQRSEQVMHPRQGPRDHLSHELRVDPASKLHQILGGGHFRVNSLHHQGIDRLASRLRATAWSEDGLVEGIEAADGSWLLGVQFHPEELTPRHPFARRLFEAFVDHCGSPDPGRRQALAGSISSG